MAQDIENNQNIIKNSTRFVTIHSNLFNLATLNVNKHTWTCMCESGVSIFSSLANVTVERMWILFIIQNIYRETAQDSANLNVYYDNKRVPHEWVNEWAYECVFVCLCLSHVFIWQVVHLISWNAKAKQE